MSLNSSALWSCSIFRHPDLVRRTAKSDFAYLFEINPMSLIVQNYRRRAPGWTVARLAEPHDGEWDECGDLSGRLFSVHRHFQSDVIDAI